MERQLEMMIYIYIHVGRCPLVMTKVANWKITFLRDTLRYYKQAMFIHVRLAMINSQMVY